MKVAPAVVGAKATDAVTPFDGSDKLLFILTGLVAVVMLLVEVFKEENKHVLRWVTAVGFLVIAAYLYWIGKGLYVLKWLRREVVTYKRLSGELKGKMEDLKKQNCEYESHNAKHLEANAKLGGEARELSEQIADLQQQIVKRDKLTGEMTQKVFELKKVDRQLQTFAEHCSGSTKEAQSVMERLERNMQLDTVNSVMMFFGRSDMNKNGRIDPEEVTLFVDNLHMLWRHLPSFDKDKMRASIIEDGGVYIEQVSDLVDAMLADPGKFQHSSATNGIV